MTTQDAQRRRRLVTRTLPISALAVAAFVAGVAMGAGNDLESVERFATAWDREDYEAMYAELTPEAAADISVERFAGTYTDAHATATTDVVETGEVAEAADGAILAVALHTHAWAELSGEIALPLEGGLVAWEPHLVYPGLQEGETLARQTRAPARASILAADGAPLAEGVAAARASPLGASAAAVAGVMDSPRKGHAEVLEAEGFPPNTLTGSSGLELAFNDRLDGRPGGRLLAVGEGDDDPAAGRVLAESQPIAGKPVRTTIEPELQEAAVIALGDHFGGVAALDARDGSVLALSGIAFSAPQPPGSTFKIVTTVAALDGGEVKLSDSFPVETAAVIEGREVANAHDEPCGGTFTESFARSCNSVFAPLGVEVGEERLVEYAERFGFNSRPQLYNAEATAAVDPPASTIPEEIGGELDVGVSAIGQGEVLATPLQLASITQTIAAAGQRSATAITRDPEFAPGVEPVRVTSVKTAKTLRDLMVRVVTEGTGSAAALPGVQVAGKTGTAELGPKALEPGQELGPDEEPELEVNAWFTGFAPASAPRLAVAAMVVNADGDGGVVAAPIVREVLAAGL